MKNKKSRLFMVFGMLIAVFMLFECPTFVLAADSYPNKPIRIILPFAPSGTSDVLGRIIGPKLTERLGQSVVFDNRPGAGGNIGTELVAKAKPDGYTLLIASPGLSISPGLYRKLNYDPMKDLAPISLMAQVPLVLATRPTLPVKNLKELVEYARANPGKITYGSSGIGTSVHLAFELLKSLAKIDIVHVPYKGAGPMLIGIMSGEVDMIVVGPATALPQLQSGKIRALAVLRNEHVPYLPNVPTTKEAGIDNFVVANWYGILAPAGTPREIIDRLNAEWVKIAAMADTIEMLKKPQLEPLSGTPEQFSKFLKAEIALWTKVIKEANIMRID